jgi:pyroglutamyl-peptidase
MSPLLICGFGPFSEAPDNPSALAVERLRQDGWAPPGVAVGYAVLPTAWTKAPETAFEAVRAISADAVLLVGVAVKSEAFRVETLARNRASQVHADAAGRLWPSAIIDAAGPAARPVIAPVEAMTAAIQAQGLPAALSSDAGDYLCNFTLFRLLAEVPMTAFLHVPAPGPRIGLDDILAAVRAAAQAFVRETV